MNTVTRHELFKAPQRGHSAEFRTPFGLPDADRTQLKAFETHLGFITENEPDHGYGARQVSFAVLTPRDLSESELQAAVATMRTQVASIEAASKQAVVDARESHAYQTPINQTAIDAALQTVEALRSLAPDDGRVSQARHLLTQVGASITAPFNVRDVQREFVPPSLSTCLAACETELRKRVAQQAAEDEKYAAFMARRGVA